MLSRAKSATPKCLNSDETRMHDLGGGNSAQGWRPAIARVLWKCRSVRMAGTNAVLRKDKLWMRFRLHTRSPRVEMKVEGKNFLLGDNLLGGVLSGSRGDRPGTHLVDGLNRVSGLDGYGDPSSSSWSWVVKGD